MEEFLPHYPFEGSVKPFHFRLTDPATKWNNGPFALSGNADGTLSVTHEAVGKEVTTYTQTLTTMLMRYKLPSYPTRIEELRTDRRQIR